MTRPLGITITIVLIAVLAVAATGIKRVPGGTHALLISNGDVRRSYGAGFHFVPPFSGHLVKYAVGEVEVRTPSVGTFHAATGDGYTVAIAIRFRLDLEEDNIEAVYRRFGEDFEAAAEKFVREAVEIVTANHSVLPGAKMPEDYSSALINEVAATLGEAQVRMSAYRVDSWDVTGSGAPLVIDPEPLRKVVVVGVDGADWRVIEPLIAAGRLPNFARLVRDGATGPLQSTEPMLSPLLWTTMATGKPPEEHGILNFTVADPETGRKVPISRLYRKVDAFWNMLSDYGRSVDIVGWLATFPAETINGVMVTDRLGYLAYADAARDETAPTGSVSPRERLSEITANIVRSDAVTFEEFSKFVHVDRDEFDASRDLAFDPKDPVNNMIMLYASTRTYADIATHLLASDKPDFLAAYFELVDATKHLFMHYAPPKQAHIDEEGYRRYQDAVAQAYVEQDRILGELIELCDNNTVLMVISDHGFKSGDSRPQLRPEIWAGKAAYWHLLDGIVCMYGPGIKKGYAIGDANILDIAPTVLALQGMPKPADMPGSVLDEVFDEALASRLNRTPVATLQRDRQVNEAALAAGDGMTEEALKKLEALGYITPDNQDAHNNLGQILQKQGRFREAIAEFEKALAINPNFPSALNNLGVCYGRIKDYGRAEEAFRRALELNPEDVFAMNNLAIMFLENRQFSVAKEFAKQAVAVEPNYANGHLTLGSIYATIGELEPARAEFERALAIDPSNQSARVNLERLQSAQGK
jgi:predicted AlkP superfamily phosphohydrolase/phosphomutase/Tfp pilus assembly protein PilF